MRMPNKPDANCIWKGSCSDVSSVLKLTIWSQPIALAGPDATICEGDTFVLTGAAANHFDSLQWSTSGSGTFNNSNALNPEYSYSEDDVASGSVVLTLTAYPPSGSACPPAVSHMILTLIPSVDIIVSDIVNTQCNANVGEVTLSSKDGSDISLNGIIKPLGQHSPG